MACCFVVVFMPPLYTDDTPHHAPHRPHSTPHTPHTYILYIYKQAQTNKHACASPRTRIRACTHVRIRVHVHTPTRAVNNRHSGNPTNTPLRHYTHTDDYSYRPRLSNRPHHYQHIITVLVVGVGHCPYDTYGHKKTPAAWEATGVWLGLRYGRM